MLNFILILIVLLFLGSKFLLIRLFSKYINLIKELIQNQSILHENFLQIQVDLVNIQNHKLSKEFKDIDVIKKTQETNTGLDPKSSFISNDDLAKLMEGKDLVFKKQVNVNPGEVLTGEDIDL